MGVFNTPFIIPLGAFAVAIVAIAGGIWSDIHNKRIRADQRMAMLARGMSTDDIEKVLGKVREEERPQKDPLRSLSNARRAGIVLVACGVGLMLFFITLEVILGHREILSGAAAGLIPLAIGIGFFVDYNLQKRELSRFGMEIDPDQPIR
jgi:Flp pilus assembly protein TadB